MVRPAFAALREYAWDHPESLLAALLAAVDPITGLPGDGALVAGIQTNWRADFVGAAGPVDPTKWTDRTVTPGDSTSARDGNGNLVITSGVGINQERILESVALFGVGCLARVALQLSAKVANVEVRAELVSVDDAGVTDSDNLAGWALLGGDSATNGRHEVAVGLLRGGAVAQSAAVTITDSTTAQRIYEITLTNDEVLYSQRAVDSTNARSQEYLRTTVPDTAKRYRLRLRVKNLGVAPAQPVTVTVGFASVTDYNEQMVEVTGGRGGATAGQQLAVTIPGSVTLASGTITALDVSATSPASVGAKVIATAGTNSTLASSTGRRVYGWALANNSAAWRYVKLYDKATAPTIGSDSPNLVIAVPPGGISVMPVGGAPIRAYSSGVGYGIVTGPTDADTGAVGANEVIGALFYK